MHKTTLLALFLLLSEEIFSGNFQSESPSVILNWIEEGEAVNVSSRYVKGVYQVHQPPASSPLVYDGYIPIYFKFQLPKWDATTMKIQFWKNHNNCTESNSYDSGYPCPVIYYMNSLIEDFAGNMTLWKNLFMDDPHPQVASEISSVENPDIDVPLLQQSGSSKILDMEYYCSRIVPHFSTFQTSAKRLDEYLKIMDSCQFENISVFINMSSVGVDLESLYHGAFASFTGNYWDKLPPAVQQESTLNMWSSLESNLLLHQFMETQKWSQAVESCQQGKIPWTLIDYERLLDILETHFYSNLQYSLAIHTSQISKYFKLSLTDCTFVGTETLFVRVLVPVHHVPIPDDNNSESSLPNPYKIVSYEPIIFHRDGEFCWLDSVREKLYVVDIKGSVHVTECSNNGLQLCYVKNDRYSSHDAADPCIQSLFDDNEEDIIHRCYMRCIPADNRPDNFKNFNFAFSAEDSFLYASSNGSEEMKVKCPATELQTLRPEKGAWNVTLQCGCEVIMGSRMNYQIGEPCKNNFWVELVQPYHWKNISFPEMGIDLNPSFHSTQYSHFGEGVRDFHSNYTTLTFHYILLWTVVIILCILVAILMYLVLQLRRWKSAESYQQSRLVYNISDSNSRDNFCMTGHQEF